MFRTPVGDAQSVVLVGTVPRNSVLTLQANKAGGSTTYMPPIQGAAGVRFLYKPQASAFRLTPLPANRQRIANLFPPADRLYLARRGMRRFHESRIVLQLSWKKQGVILTVTSRKEEHHGLVSGAVDRGRATRRQRGTVLSSQPPHPRKDARALVVAHRAHASASGQGCRSQSGHRPAVRGRVSAGGLGRPAAVESQSPGERDGRLSRVDPRLLREATSHDHRRGVRTHLSTDRVAPRAQPGAQVPQGSGPEVLPGPCDPRAAKKKTWPSTLQTKPLFSKPN